MGFPWTLQRYIFREMGKTFLLTAAAMTIVLGLGGGVMNMIKLGEVTPGQLFRLLALMIPVSVALTLPIAALFSSASTYGRISADNELVACRSCGINLHVLFLPTLVLSLLAGIVTFGFTNFLIPGMAKNLDELVGADPSSMIRHHLKKPRGIKLGKGLRARAADFAVDPENPNRIALFDVTFVELKADEWVRFGMAGTVDLLFDRSKEKAQIAARMLDVSFFDRESNQFTDVEEKLFPRNDLPRLLPYEIKFLTLGELMFHWKNPEHWPPVKKKMAKLRGAYGKRIALQNIVKDWQSDHSIALNDTKSATIIRSENALLVPRDGGIELHDVSIDETADGIHRQFTADRALIQVTQSDITTDSDIDVTLFDVEIRDSSRTYRRAREKIGPIQIPDDVREEMQAVSTSEMLLASADSKTNDVLAVARDEAITARDETVRRIIGTIHQRFAFSASALVLVILGAILGIVLRGSHTVTAFGISFVPSLLVIITIVTGRQMSQNLDTHIAGLVVMWAGIVFVAALDTWLLTRVLRR